MTFLLPLGLLVGLAVAFPIIAHALRKGRTRPMAFPAAHLVPERKSSARQRHRIEDKFLLALRMLLVACLALLAATPFVQCSRLSLSRTNGASVAAALVIDDSASMRARVDGQTSRLDRAIQGAHQLLDTARPGDSFSIVLAGKPARILTPSTTELSGVRDALDEIAPSDRPTDLEMALVLARGLQGDLPQTDRPIVVFSDLSHPTSFDLVDVVLPEAGLRGELHNCALLTAVRSTEAVQVEIACTSSSALEGRTLKLVDQDGSDVAAPVEAKDGAVRLKLPNSSSDKHPQLKAVLSRSTKGDADAIPEDDSCVVLENRAALSIAVRADQGKAGMKTGAGTVLQAALEALDRKVRVQTISLLPDRAQELDAYGALLIDDPSGFTPEISDALTSWIEKGGVALSFLGPGISQTPLGSSFAPFLLGAPKWERTDAKGTDAKQPGTLGPLSNTWAEIDTRSRATWPSDEGSQIKALWDDGQPFVVEKALGRGLLLTVSLPASVDISDLALRPAFLELMDHVVSESAIRRGAQATTVGSRWRVGSDAAVRSSAGQLLEKHASVNAEEDAGTYVEPDVAGRYSISYPEVDDGKPTHRFAMRDHAEHVTQPNSAVSVAGSQKQQSTLTRVGISREIALLALIIAALELAFRAIRRGRGSRPLQSAIS